MASKEHMKKQLSTEEQLRRYNARSPEEQEARRVARRARRNKTKLHKRDKKLAHMQKKEAKIANFVNNSLNTFPSLKPTSFVCLDLEMFERNQRKLTEVGITTYDAETKRIRTRHLIIEGNYKLRNKRFVCDNKDNYMFGESEFVSMSEARKVIERALAKCPRVVGHDVGGDLRWVRKHLNVKTDHCVIYDTIRMHKIIERTKQARKLCKCCDDYGLFHEAPHNAGNDSHVNMYLFVGMSKKIRNLRTTEIRKAA